MSTERKPFTKKQREAQKARFDGRCGYCGVKTERLQIDHMKPLIANGTHEESNWMPACAQCNNYKHFYNVEEFRGVLEDQIRLGLDHSVNFRFAARYKLIELTPKPVRFYFEESE